MAISNVSRALPPTLFIPLKLKARSGMIGNVGDDACASTAALTDTTDVALPDARNPFQGLQGLQG
eukprot:1133151-Pelagomonas_calceolata.AAC.12